MKKEIGYNSLDSSILNCFIGTFRAFCALLMDEARGTWRRGVSWGSFPDLIYGSVSGGGWVGNLFIASLRKSLTGDRVLGATWEFMGPFSIILIDF